MFRITGTQRHQRRRRQSRYSRVRVRWRFQTLKRRSLKFQASDRRDLQALKLRSLLTKMRLRKVQVKTCTFLGSGLADQDQTGVRRRMKKMLSK